MVPLGPFSQFAFTVGTYPRISLKKLNANLHSTTYEVYHQSPSMKLDFLLFLFLSYIHGSFWICICCRQEVLHRITWIRLFKQSLLHYRKMNKDYYIYFLSLPSISDFFFFHFMWIKGKKKKKIYMCFSFMLILNHLWFKSSSSTQPTFA